MSRIHLNQKLVTLGGMEFMLLFYKNKTRKSCDFIDEYIVGDCQGIGMNWRF